MYKVYNILYHSFPIMDYARAVSLKMWITMDPQHRTKLEEIV